MFTDLGTDFSTVVIRREQPTVRLKRRILLRIVIISTFLFGGVLGTFLFLQFQFNAFLFPVLLLVMVLLYDYFRFQLLRLMRRYK